MSANISEHLKIENVSENIIANMSANMSENMKIENVSENMSKNMSDNMNMLHICASSTYYIIEKSDAEPKCENLGFK